MIVCSCNVLSDDDVRNAVNASNTSRAHKQIYGCLGCSAECGRCARTIKTIIDDALGACAKACCSGCRTAANWLRTSLTDADSHVHAEPSLEALA